MPSAQLIICTLGTRGDFDPFLLLASALKERGFHTTLLSNSNWRPAALAAGIEFEAIAEQDSAQSNRNDLEFFKHSILPSFRKSFDFIEAKCRNGERPFLLHRSNMLGSECASERFELAAGRVILQPSAIKSCQMPPWPMSMLTAGPWGGLGRKFVVPSLYRIGERTSPYRPLTDDFRRSVALPPLSRSKADRENEGFNLLLCPRWFAQPQPDWPQNVYTAGFPVAPPGTLPDNIAAFVANRGAPLVCTPGTGVDKVADFFRCAAEARSRLKLPAIFLSKFVPEQYRADANILCADYVDLAALLPRCRAIIHHGGIGTIAQSMRAGIPQLVIPDRFDQPDNAMRAARLGLAAAIFSRKFSGADWADLLGQLMNNAHVRTQIQTAAKMIYEEEGVQIAASIIEQHVRQASDDAVAA